jgi:hypothetical protein
LKTSSQILLRFYPTRDWGQLRGEERSQRRRAIGLLAALFLALALAAVGFARYAQEQRVVAEERLAQNYWQNSRAAQAAGENLEALYFVAEAIRLSPSLRDTLLLDVRAIQVPSLRGMVAHQDVIYGARFSRDESRILTWSEDGTVRLWNARTGQPIGRALQHQSWVNGAQFSRDENRILTWSQDGTARLWDARTGQQIGPALHHQGAINGAQFSRDEGRILTWSADNTARAWLLNADLDFPAEHVELWIKAVTGSEYDFVTRRVKSLDPERWRLIREHYEEIAVDHAKTCKYPDANHWISLSNER